MPCLTVRDLSPRTLSSLKTRAKSNHRSLNGEILYIFEWIADNGLKMPPPIEIEGVMDPAVARQKSAMDSLIGTCGDKRRLKESLSAADQLPGSVRDMVGIIPSDDRDAIDEYHDHLMERYA